MNLKAAVFSVGLAAALLPGCGPRSAPSGKGPVRVTFWHAMGGPLGDALDSMIAEFERANPGLDIEPVSMGGYTALSQKLMGAVQVNSPPNMAQMYESWTSHFHSMDKLVVLDSLVRGPDGLSDGELADFYSAFLDDNSWGGKIVTMPFNKSVPVFFYNVGLLAEAGYHEFPRTWDEFRIMVKKLTRPDKGVHGTAGGVNEWMFGCMLRQQGGDLLDDSGRAVFNSAAGVKAARYMYDLVAFDSSAVFGTGYDPQNDFLSGKIACIWGTSVSWAFMRPNMTFPVAVAPVPTWDRPNVLSFGTNVGVFRTGTPDQVAACWRFIKWFTSTAGQARWARATAYVPCRRSSLELPEYREFVGQVPGLDQALAQLDYVSFEPRTEAWFSGRRLLGEALERVMRGAAPAQQALDEAAQAVEKEMSR